MRVGAVRVPTPEDAVLTPPVAVASNRGQDGIRSLRGACLDPTWICIL